jgi:hypothetical protein
MGCNQNCNQGRSCICSGKADRTIVIVATLLLIIFVCIGFEIYSLLNGNAGQECAIEVQFKEGVKATYIGTTI